MLAVMPSTRPCEEIAGNTVWGWGGDVNKIHYKEEGTYFFVTVIKSNMARIWDLKP